VKGVPPFLWSGAVVLALVFATPHLNLEPQVTENFFFSSDDPQLLADRKISGFFPQPPQIIIGVKGDVHSHAYVRKIEGLTAELSSLPGVTGVFSLTKGPRDPKDAFESPLWKRFLVARDGSATFLSVLVEEVPLKEFAPKIEAVRDRWQAADFQIMFSGAPYITELIRRHLLRDLKVFTFVALGIFCGAIYAIFRSIRILVGCLVSCAGASILALLAAQFLEIPVGPLTANLATIVFVLTLSHIVFLTFNWKELLQEKAGRPVWGAVRMTFHASLWSMLTTLLGFFSLIFTHATPLRHLGVSGSLGTLVAFLVAYLVYPSFLIGKTAAPAGGRIPGGELFPRDPFFRKRHPRVFFGAALFAAVVSIGLGGINTDPTLFSYFKEGGEIRKGLEYVDENGGSVPLRVLVTDPKKRKLSTKDAYNRLFDLHRSLERDPAVGSVVSLPVLVAEARRSPWLSVVPTDVLVNMMEWERFGAAARHFITPDRLRALFLLRMNEHRRDAPRKAVVERLKEKVRQSGFEPEIVGGVYLLQGQLARLVSSSMLYGLASLTGLFFLMGWFLSRSLRVAGAMGASLVMISAAILGPIGLLGVPFDVISAPAVNVAIGMGIDAMIHLLFFVRNRPGGAVRDAASWGRACVRLWKPILCSVSIVSSGFGIFTLSSFPPTQRFGLSVVLGMLFSSLAALFIFPFLSSALIKE
jgi:predicted RND superfamily exporter protein